MKWGWTYNPSTQVKYGHHDVLLEGDSIGSLDDFRDWYVSRYHSRPLPTLFLTMMLPFIIFTLILTLIWNEYLILVLGEMSQHVFMDYFWSVCDSMNNPYTVMKVIYPPFAVAIYSLIGHITLPYVTQDTGDLYIDMFNSQVPMMVFIILMGFSIYLLLTVCKESLKTTLEDKEKTLFTLVILLSFPLIIALQNGNSIIYALSFLLVFLLGYRSENRWIRYFSYACLGFVTGMKLSPGIFALLILRERKYKEFAICAIIVSFIVLAPIVFTDGTVAMIIENLFVIDRETGGSINNIPKLFYSLSKILEMPIIDTIGVGLTGAITVLTMIIMVLDTRMKNWEVITLAVMCIINGFGIGTPYLYMYVIVAIIFFLREEKEATRINLLCLILLTLPLILIPMVLLAIKSCSTMILLFALLILGVKNMIGMLKEDSSEKEVRNSLDQQ